MIVFDCSSLISAAFRPGNVPDRAVRHALATDTVAVSDPMLAELVDVLYRPRLARWIDPAQRAALLGLIHGLGILIKPAVAVTDCRDPKDDIYLELALAADAGTIVSSDCDLLVLNPWRGVSIVNPAEYLSRAVGPAGARTIGCD